MNDIHKTVIREMANCDMNCNRVAKKIYRSRSSMNYYIDKIKQ